MELMKGLINVLLEQEINWDGGISIPGTVSDTIESGDSLLDILNGGDDTSPDDSGGGGGGLGDLLPGIGGGWGDRGVTEKWKFNRNPTGQMRTDLNNARANADGYTKGNIYVKIEDDGTEKLVLAGKSINGRPHLFDVVKNDEGKWGWLNDGHDPPLWEDFKDY